MMKDVEIGDVCVVHPHKTYEFITVIIGINQDSDGDYLHGFARTWHVKKCRYGQCSINDLNNNKGNIYLLREMEQKG